MVYDSPRRMEKAGFGAENKVLLDETCGELSGSRVRSYLSTYQILSLIVNSSTSKERTELESDDDDHVYLEGFFYFHNGKQ